MTEHSDGQEDFHQPLVVESWRNGNAFVHKHWDAPTTSASVGPATEQQQPSFNHRHQSLYSGEPEGMLAMGPE